MRSRTMVLVLVVAALLVVLAIVLIPQSAEPEHASTKTSWPTQGWHTTTPEDQGFDSAKLAEALEAIQERRINVDSLLIVRRDSVLLDAYFYDPYDGTFPHDLASVTKSFTTTLIGIAADRGIVQLDQPMVSYFSNRTIANLDARKESMTVRHLAGMVNGFASGCMADDDGTLDRMRSASDWVQSALDRSMIREPGTAFCYDSPGMHLLSAILQETSGMTALEFARKHLFEPLGIRDAIWESDPQGYTHGWGDLHLKPTDAAKLGYLWLNRGVWDGVQLVPPAWVEESVKAQSEAGGEHYGYGWWVSEDGYHASGRGGQSIRVYPSLDLIIVTTASGMDFDEIGPYLEAAFVDPDHRLPANPAGVAQLQAALASLVKPPPPLPVGPLPDTAKEISGKTYVFGENLAEVESLRFEFNDSTEATMYLTRQGSDVIWNIGLDNKYHLSSDGLQLRGYWDGPRTLVVEVFDIGVSTLHMYFEEDRVLIEAPGVEFEGQAGNP